MPAWMKWAVGIFIIYAIATNGGHRQSDTPQDTREQSTPEQIAEDYKNKVFGKGRNNFSTEDKLAGTGAPVFCGQKVKLHYQPLDGEGKPAGESETRQFYYGKDTLAPALERALPGMRAGGKRLVNAGAYAQNAETAARFEIELVEATPALPDLSKLMFRAFDTAPGSGSAIDCGQPVKAHVTVWNLEGKKTFSTEGKDPLILTTGNGTLPMGIEIGITGLRTGGSRTLIIPPALAKPMHGNKPPAGISLPGGQTAIVDIEITR